tara:strand:+ start:386 stop:802 length:417 start_codon:yes stop_codon:yes gene_type:complete
MKTIQLTKKDIQMYQEDIVDHLLIWDSKTYETLQKLEIDDYNLEEYIKIGRTKELTSVEELILKDRIVNAYDDELKSVKFKKRLFNKSLKEYNEYQSLNNLSNFKGYEKELEYLFFHYVYDVIHQGAWKDMLEIYKEK